MIQRLRRWARLLELRGLAKGFEEELGFWRSYVRDHGPEACDPVIWKEAFPSRLHHQLESLGVPGAGKPRVLEVGSGPVSLLAWGAHRDLFEVTAIDPLARQYSRLVQRLPCSYPVKPVYGLGEDVDTLFGSDTFDLAYSANALDHARSPRRCLQAMCSVVREDGFLYCEGFVREGSNAGWRGLHQHDLVPEEGGLVSYGRDGTRSELTRGLPLELIDQRIEPLNERGLRSHGYEWDGTDARDWRTDAWYTVLFTVGDRAGRDQ